MEFLQREFSPSQNQSSELPAWFEFTSPRIVPTKSDQISPSRSLWDQYNKRKEIEEKHSTDFYAIMQAVAQDGYVKTAVSKYVNSIFLRGYQVHSLKKDLIDYLQLRLRFVSESMGENTDNFFHRIAYDLVAYANVYVQKIRFDYPDKVLPKRLKSIKGLPIMKNKKLVSRDPIAGYDLIHPATMHIFRDRFGNVVRYEQWPLYARKRPTDLKQIRVYDPSEIVHIVIDREDNFAYGTPFLGAVIDDIRMLRLIEDHASRLAFRYAFPFTQVRIGDMKPGFQATEEDLIYYRRLVGEAPPDATLVTNEKVKFEVVGAQGAAIDLSPYLKHFEDRTFTGLQVPAVSMGRGDSASRSTADAMTTEMHDQIKHFQNIMSRAISDEIYQELLREAGYSFFDDVKNDAKMVFEEIEVESKIKRETHIMGLVQANLITISEARIMLGRQKFTDTEWEDSYLIKVLIPQAIVKDTGLIDLDEHGKLKLEAHKTAIAQAKAEVDNVKAATDNTKADTDQIKNTPPPQNDGPHTTTTKTHHVTTGGGKRSVKKTVQIKKPMGRPLSVKSGPSKGTDNKNRPANQHGKKSGPKRSTELHISESVTSHSVDFLTTVSRFETAIRELYKDLQGGAIEQGIVYMRDINKTEPKLAELLFNLIEDRLTSVSRSYLMPAYREGSTAFSTQALERGLIISPVEDFWLNERKALEEFNEKTMARLVRDVARPTLTAIKKATDETALAEKVKAIFEAQSYRLTLIANTECPQAFWFGYASAAYAAGIDLDVVAEADACDDCLEQPGFEHLSSARARLKKTPTVHPQCDCALEIAVDPEEDDQETGE